MHFVSVPSLLRRRPGGRFQAVLFRSFSRVLRSSPCRGFSRRLRSNPSLLVSYRGASPPCRFIARLRISIPFGSTPCHLSSGHVRAFQFRLPSVADPVITDPSVSISIRSVPRPFAALSIQRVASPIVSVSVRVSGPRFLSLPCHCQTCLSYAMPCPISALRLASLPCSAISNHLRYSQRRAVSALLYSSLSKADHFRCRSCPGASGYAQRCHIKSWNLVSKLCPGSSLPFTAGLFLFRSDLCASAGLVSSSARFGSCPSFAVAPPCLSGRIGSPHRRRISCLHGSMPSHCISCLGRTNPSPFDSTQIRADHLRVISSPFDVKPLTSKPWRFSAACADQCRACSILLRSMRLSAVSFLFVSEQSHSVPFRIKAGRGHAVSVRRQYAPHVSIASPGDENHCCAAPLPRSDCLV